MKIRKKRFADRVLDSASFRGWKDEGDPAKELRCSGW